MGTPPSRREVNPLKAIVIPIDWDVKNITFSLSTTADIDTWVTQDFSVAVAVQPHLVQKLRSKD